MLTDEPTVACPECVYDICALCITGYLECPTLEQRKTLRAIEDVLRRDQITSSDMRGSMVLASLKAA